MDLSEIKASGLFTTVCTYQYIESGKSAVLTECFHIFLQHMAKFTKIAISKLKYFTLFFAL
jgi:hypothetical protein